MKTKVFVSYSHRDAGYLASDSLLGYLKGLEQEGVEFWWDEALVTGQRWDDEIKAQINATDIALVLVSQWFLDSAYCTEVEIGEFLQHSRDKGLVILPIILSACEWQRHAWLRNRQFLPRGGETIEEHYTDPGRRKRLFHETRQDLRKHIERLRQSRNAAGQDLDGATVPRASSVNVQRPEFPQGQSQETWRAELVTHGGWNISLRIFLDQETHLLEYRRSLTDQAIAVDGESVLSEFSLPVSNDARSTYTFEISKGSARFPATIDIKHQHMKIIGFRLAVADNILYNEGYL
jgi:hypothetical protein